MAEPLAAAGEVEGLEAGRAGSGWSLTKTNVRSGQWRRARVKTERGPRWRSMAR